MGQEMADPKGEGLKLGFDGSLRLEFHGAKVTSDAGLLAYRDLDEALALFDSVPSVFHDSRTGRNIQHDLTALLRQSVYSRLAGYEDVNDAHRLSVDPTMRRITGKKIDNKNAASANTMGRFETKMLSVKDNLQALSEVNGRWVERALEKTTHRRIILDMDLHLLLHLWLSACRRYDLVLQRYDVPRISAGWNRRTHDPQRRGLAASGRSLACARQYLSQPEAL